MTDKYVNCIYMTLSGKIQCYHSKGCIYLTNDGDYIVQASIVVVDNQIKFIDSRAESE